MRWAGRHASSDWGSKQDEQLSARGSTAAGRQQVSDAWTTTAIKYLDCAFSLWMEWSCWSLELLIVYKYSCWIDGLFCNFFLVGWNGHSYCGAPEGPGPGGVLVLYLTSGVGAFQTNPSRLPTLSWTRSICCATHQTTIWFSSCSTGSGLLNTGKYVKNMWYKLHIYYILESIVGYTQISDFFFCVSYF